MGQLVQAMEGVERDQAPEANRQPIDEGLEALRSAIAELDDQIGSLSQRLNGVRVPIDQISPEGKDPALGPSRSPIGEAVSQATREVDRLIRRVRALRFELDLA